MTCVTAHRSIHPYATSDSLLIILLYSSIYEKIDSVTNMRNNVKLND